MAGLEASSIQQVPLKSLTKEKFTITLQQAVRDGHEDEVIQILDSTSAKRRKKVLNAFDTHGFTAVHYAARFNRFKILQLLYNEKADPKVKTEDGLTPLHYAARYTPIFKSQTDETDTNAPIAANKQIIQLLVLWKVDINAQDIYGVTPLHLACSRGNRVAVQVLLAIGGINVNIQDKQQDTPLHDACLFGNEWIVEQLLDHGADVLITNDENLMPLHIACREGFTDVVKVIMRKRFDYCQDMVTSYDNQYNTPLHFACRSGNVEIAKLLFLNRADPTAVKDDGITPLHIAARENFVGIAEVLLQFEGLDINVRDDELNTPLHLAARFDNIEMIEFLLKRGADIEAQDEDSNTPLLTAVAYGQKKAMETLLVNKCSVDVVDRNGKSIVFIAAERNQAELLKSMLNGSVAEYCEDMLGTTDSINNTPMHIACAKGNIEALKVLLRSSIKVDARNEADKTPMHLAAANGNTGVVKELIRHGDRVGIDLIEDEDDDSNTPLHLACANGHYNVAKTLLEAEADPDVRNARHWTPLDWAAFKGRERIVQLLIEFEAEVDPKDKAGITPLLLACKEGHLKVVQVLLDNNANVSNTNQHHENSLDIAVENGHKDVAMAIVKSKQMVQALRNTTRPILGKKVITPLRRIIRKMPEVAEVVFNRCAVSNGDEVNKDDPNYTITFNYEFLEDFSDKTQESGRGTILSRAFTKRGRPVNDARSVVSGTDNGTESLIGDDTDGTIAAANKASHGFSTKWGPKGYDKSNHCLHILAKSKSVELLRHPIVTSLLNHKWRAYGQTVYFGNLFIYAVFIVFLTTFALIVSPPTSSTCMFVEDPVNATEYAARSCHTTTRSIAILVTAAIVILFGLVKLSFEVFQLLKLHYRYFTDWVNYIEIVLYAGSIYFAVIYGNRCFCPTNSQWQLGALCLFLGWIDLVIYMRKFPITGIYVVMFLNIFYIFLKLAFLAVLLILSFAFSFYMLFNEPESDIRTPFNDPGRSIIKTMTMTTGEFEFDSTFRQGSDRGGDPDLEYAAVSYILWILFLVLMPILLTNLLVGLAVDDIKGIQQTAELKRLALRVELTLSVEELLPRSIRRKFIIGERKISPNRRLTLLEKLWYKALKFERFDDLETITNALNPPPMPINEVVDQSTSLNKKVDDMQLQLDTLSDQNTKLLELMESVIQGGGVALPHPFERSTSKTASGLRTSTSPVPTSPSII